MRDNYEALNTAVLQKLYEEQARELERAVLSGNAWDIVSIKRRRLTELSKILHEKLQAQNNDRPSESAFTGRDGRDGPRI